MLRSYTLDNSLEFFLPRVGRTSISPSPLNPLLYSFDHPFRSFDFSFDAAILTISACTTFFISIFLFQTNSNNILYYFRLLNCCASTVKICVF